MSRPSVVVGLLLALSAFGLPAIGCTQAPPSIEEVRALLREGDVERAERGAERLRLQWRNVYADQPDSLVGREVELAELFVERGSSELAAHAASWLTDALDRLETAQPSASTPSTLAAAARLHRTRAQARYEAGDRDGALRDLSRTLELQTLLGEPVAAPDSHLEYERGYVLYEQGSTEEAAAAWRRAVDARQREAPDDHDTLVWWRSDLAEMERTLGHYDEAEVLLEQAVEQSRTHRTPDRIHAVLLNNLAGLYLDQDRLDRAERLYREALAQSLRLYDEIEGDEARREFGPRVARAHLNLGAALRNQDKLENARDEFHLALTLGRELFAAGSQELVFVLGELAWVLDGLDLHADARRLRDEALASLADDAPLPPDAGQGDAAVRQERRLLRAVLRHDEAVVALRQGQPARAETLLREVLRLRVPGMGEDHPEVARSRAALARAVAQQGDVAQAGSLCDEALDVLERTWFWPSVRAETYALRATLRRERGQREAAVEDMELALDLVEELRPQRGGHEESRLQFLARFRNQVESLVDWYVEDGRPIEALRTAERLRARILRDQLAASRVDLRRDVPAAQLAPLERRERATKARLAAAQRELQSARRADDGSSSRSQERGSQEESVRDGLLELRDIQGQIALASPSQGELLRATSSDLPLAEVQREILGSRRGLLYYQIGPRRSHVFYLPPEGALRVYPLELAPASGAGGIDPAPGEAPAADHAPTAGDGLSPEDPSSHAIELLALLEGTDDAGDRQGVLGALRGVTGIRPMGEPHSTTPEPSRRVATPRDALTERLRRLFHAVVPAELWSELTALSEVVVVPDGALHGLPFEALVVDAAKSDQTDRYWLDVGPVVRYAHGLTALWALHQRRLGMSTSQGGASQDAGDTGATDLVVSLSEPVLVGRREAGVALPALPGTARETEAIVESFGAERVRVLRGDEATEGRLRTVLPSARYVHLATHGLVETTSSALLASLVLTAPDRAADTDDDGLLQLFEIYDLALSCELAVLSACATSLGRRVEGEGVFALSRGFHAAGARQTIASLWSVEDRSTAALMRRLFSEIAVAESAGVTPDVARLLRDAKRDVRAKAAWSDPYFWAPFVLSGAPSSPAPPAPKENDSR